MALKIPMRAFALVGLLALAAGCAGMDMAAHRAAMTPSSGSSVPKASGLRMTLMTVPKDPAVGNVELVVSVMDANGDPVTGATVRISADMTDHPMGDLSGEAADQGTGRYSIVMNLGMAGEWKIMVKAAASREEAADEFPVTVK